MTFNTPVLLIVFNRPKLTQILINRLKAEKINNLFIACDGPRNNSINDTDLVGEVKNIIYNIDWNCNVKYLVREENLGCKIAVSSAISWFFDNVDEGIILEDDCIPTKEFFIYCDELLKYYRNDERIGIICGTSLVDLKKEKIINENYDYIFSNYPSIWGWATWKRVWVDYDVNIKNLPVQKYNLLSKFNRSKLSYKNIKILEDVRQMRIDTWDYQLSFMLWTSNRLAVVPRMNLVENLGFSVDATHTKSKYNKLASMSKIADINITFPLIKNKFIIEDSSYKNFIEKFANRGVFTKAMERIFSYLTIKIKK